MGFDECMYRKGIEKETPRPSPLNPSHLEMSRVKTGHRGVRHPRSRRKSRRKVSMKVREREYLVLSEWI